MAVFKKKSSFSFFLLIFRSSFYPAFLCFSSLLYSYFPPFFCTSCRTRRIQTVLRQILSLFIDLFPLPTILCILLLVIISSSLLTVLSLYNLSRRHLPPSLSVVTSSSCSSIFYFYIYISFLSSPFFGELLSAWFITPRAHKKSVVYNNLVHSELQWVERFLSNVWHVLECYCKFPDGAHVHRII